MLDNPKTSEGQRVVAAFDFDGTITYRDTLLPFLLYCDGNCKAAWELATVAPFLVYDMCTGAPRQTMKERILTRFFKNKPIELLREKATHFAASALPAHVRPEALQRLRWHQQQGHRCVLISASVDLYLEPWARKVGFHDVISSRLATDAQANVTGKLIGLNCWGPEKVRRLQELLGPKDSYVLYAYGDSRGDKELLALADHPHLKVMPNV